MINYADYEYYTDTYKGAVLDTASFDINARKATQIIKLHTFDRVEGDNIPDEVKMCCCELAEYIYSMVVNKTSDLTIKGLSSESNSHYAVSYESAEKRKQSELTGQMEIINLWLDHTGLLYRGIDYVCRK